MKKNIETSDIVMASYLKAKGYSLDKISKEGNKGIFHLSDVHDSALQDFHLGKALVEPVLLNNTIKSLVTATRRII